MKNPKQQKNNVDKRDEMRSKYDHSASYYESRYKYIQFLKYSILLPEIADFNIKNNTLYIRFPGICLDFGAGTKLLHHYLIELNQFITQKYQNPPNLNGKWTPIECAFFQYFNHTTMGKIHSKFKKVRIDVSYQTPFIISVDISYEMLKQRELDNTLFSQSVACDGQNTPFRDDTFDNIFSFTCIQNLDDMEAGLQEIQRIGHKNTSIGISILDQKDFISKYMKIADNFENILNQLEKDKNKIISQINTNIDFFKDLDCAYQNEPITEIPKIEDEFFYRKVSRNSKLRKIKK